MTPPMERLHPNLETTQTWKLISTASTLLSMASTVVFFILFTLSRGNIVQRFPFLRYISFIALCDLGMCVGLLLTSFGGGDSVCLAQGKFLLYIADINTGLIVFYFNEASIFWQSVFAWKTFTFFSNNLDVSNPLSPKGQHWYEHYTVLHAICWLVPGGIAMYLGLDQAIGGGELWCWISHHKGHIWQRWALFYAPLILVLVVCTLFFVKSLLLWGKTKRTAPQDVAEAHFVTLRGVQLQLYLYISAFGIIWIPPLGNAVYMLLGGSPVMWMGYVEAGVLPLQGFLNTIVFSWSIGVYRKIEGASLVPTRGDDGGLLSDDYFSLSSSSEEEEGKPGVRPLLGPGDEDDDVVLVDDDVVLVDDDVVLVDDDVEEREKRWDAPDGLSFIPRNSVHTTPGAQHEYATEFASNPFFRHQSRHSSAVNDGRELRWRVRRSRWKRFGSSVLSLTFIALIGGGLPHYMRIADAHLAPWTAAALSDGIGWICLSIAAWVSSWRMKRKRRKKLSSVSNSSGGYLDSSSDIRPQRVGEGQLLPEGLSGGRSRFLKVVIPVALLQGAAPAALMMVSTRAVPNALSLMMLGTAPVFAALLKAVYQIRRPLGFRYEGSAVMRDQFVGLLLGIMAVSFICLPDAKLNAQQTTARVLGTAAGIAAAVAFALGTVIHQVALERDAALAKAWWQGLTSAIMWSSIALASGSLGPGMHDSFRTLPVSTWLWIVFYGGVGWTFLGTWLTYRTLRRTGAVGFCFIRFVVPAVSMFASYADGVSEGPQWLQWVGMVWMLGSIVAVSHKRWPRWPKAWKRRKSGVR